MLSKLLVNTHRATCIQSSTQHVKTIFIIHTLETEPINITALPLQEVQCLPSVAIIDLMTPLLVLWKNTLLVEDFQEIEILRENFLDQISVCAVIPTNKRRHSSGDFGQGAKTFQHSVSASVAFGLKWVQNAPHPWALGARRACQMLIRPQAGDLEGEAH